MPLFPVQDRKSNARMSRQTFRLVLLVSCAHALVHVYELSLPSVEQLIGDEFHVGKSVTGWLGSAWRLPFGLGALLAGWLADRYGSKPLLILYLAGCALTSAATWAAGSLNIVFLLMFGMGSFASIYHPAGLSLISHETTPENRGAALGWHGIFGSIGIGGAPFIAAIVFSTRTVTWREYYLLLALLGAVLAFLLTLFLVEHHRQPSAAMTNVHASHGREDRYSWRSYFLLVTVGATAGVIYGAFVHFLPRYLDSVGDYLPGILKREGDSASAVSPESLRNFLTTLVMMCALVGQALAGRIARPGRMEWQLSIIMFAAAPALVWVGFAEGVMRVAAACTVAFFHFMTQPIYNSLIAQYVPPARRSVGYGFSNMVGFGIGALGPAFAGLTQDNRLIYGTLAGFAVCAGLLSFALARQERRIAV